MSEPRWIGQKDRYSCGAIGVANVLKWAGIGWNWDADNGELKELCRTDKEFGTTQNNLEVALRKVAGKRLVIQRRRKWTLDKVVDCVEGRGCVLFNFTPALSHNLALPVEERVGHYAALVDVLGSGRDAFAFKMVNYHSGETVTWMEREWFKSVFSRRRADDLAWFIRQRAT